MILTMRSHEALGATDAGGPKKTPGGRGELPRIRGLLILYYALLVFFVVHNSALTVGSVAVYAHHSAAGRSRVLIPSLIFYVVMNLVLILYVIYLFRLMSRRRRSAIINNIVFNLLSAILLLSWHLIGEKSTTGTIADSAPSLVIVAYFLLSRRVRMTFVIGRTTGQSADTPGRLPRDALAARMRSIMALLSASSLIFSGRWLRVFSQANSQGRPRSRYRPGPASSTRRSSTRRSSEDSTAFGRSARSVAMTGTQRLVHPTSPWRGRHWSPVGQSDRRCCRVPGNLPRRPPARPGCPPGADRAWSANPPAARRRRAGTPGSPDRICRGPHRCLRHCALDLAPRGRSEGGSAPTVRVPAVRGLALGKGLAPRDRSRA